MKKNDEFLGIGKTWLGVYIMIGFAGAMVFTGDIEAAEFLQQCAIYLGIGGGKSALKWHGKAH